MVPAGQVRVVGDQTVLLRPRLWRIRDRAPRGAFLLATTLARLAFVGLALQGLVLRDLADWMLVGRRLLLAGVLAARRIPTPDA